MLCDKTDNETALLRDISNTGGRASMLNAKRGCGRRSLLCDGQAFRVTSHCRGQRFNVVDGLRRRKVWVWSKQGRKVSLGIGIAARGLPLNLARCRCSIDKGGML